MDAKPKSTEREFGFSVGAVCGVLAAVAIWRGRTTVSVFLGGMAVGLIGLAAVWPSLLRGPSRLWWRLARLLSWFNTRALLSAFFFLVLTPAGLIARAAGQDPLRRKRGPRRSNWTPYPRRPVNRYERMY